MKRAQAILWSLVLSATLGPGIPDANGVSCDCSDGAGSGLAVTIQDWGDDPADWTGRQESPHLRRDWSQESCWVQKAGSGEMAYWDGAPPARPVPSDRDPDILRVTIERSHGYADRDPIWNDSDPYIRFWVRAPGGADWSYQGPSDVVEGCNGSDCDAVFDWTMDEPVGRSGLWDVGPELWDDDGGWSDDELLGLENYYQVPYPGLALEWRDWDDDSEYHCQARLSVAYLDNGVDEPAWVGYPSGTVSQALFTWTNPADRSGITAELHLSEDATFGPSDPYIYPVNGDSFDLDCGGVPPADGQYYFAVRVVDGAGHWSGYVSPLTPFTFLCPTPTPTPTEPTTPTPSPTRTPTPDPQGTPTPTGTPEPTATVDPFATPSPPPSPTNIPTEEPTATAAPTDLWYRLEMPDLWLERGDEFLLSRSWGNPLAQPLAVQEYIILDLEGDYWFWPGWRMEIDWLDRILPAAAADQAEILRFSWPEVTGSMEGIRFWGAFLGSGPEDVVYDFVDWGFG